jgi:hypothetical protein
MPKPRLSEPYRSLEADIINVLLTGLHQWRPDLDYPQSQSDMQGAVRNLITMFNVKRRDEPFSLPIDEVRDGMRLSGD